MLLALSLLAAGCAGRPWAEEPALRDRSHKEELALLQRVRAYEDPALTAYLERLAQRLTGATLPFTVVRDPTLNLFAMPTGAVFVHTGVLAAADGEAQLAAILAHEISHVLDRDPLEDGDPDPVEPRLDGEALTSPTAAAIFALRLPLAARAAMTGYGHARERAADATGLASLERAGWDPTEAPVVFLRLAAQAQDGGAREVFFFGNRRRLGERIDTMRTLVAFERVTSGELPGRVRSSEEFERVVRPAARENAYEEMRQGRFAAARRQLDALAVALADDPVWHLYYGDLHRLEAQRAATAAERAVEATGARAAYERALQLDPGRAEVHRQLGFLYYASNDLARAREELERYLTLVPGAPDAARIGEYVRELAP